MEYNPLPEFYPANLKKAYSNTWEQEKKSCWSVS